ncbi:MAG: branched-chain amino acid ABC transporter substrate-binding protein, partial [Actinobacteria bacterium]
MIMLSGALALGLFAAACGSDDSEGGAGTTASGGAGTTAAGGADTTSGEALEP